MSTGHKPVPTADCTRDGARYPEVVGVHLHHDSMDAPTIDGLTVGVRVGTTHLVFQITESPTGAAVQNPAGPHMATGDSDYSSLVLDHHELMTELQTRIAAAASVTLELLTLLKA